MTDTTIDEYVHQLFAGEDSQMRGIRERSLAQGLPAIQVPEDVGRLLAVLITASSATRILEIGTLFGYSSILMARALRGRGTIDSLEVDPKHVSVARENLVATGFENVVTVHEGPASETLASLPPDRYDLAFIDADKGAYPDYLRESLRLVRPGGMIVADNVWRHGGAAQPHDENDRGIAEFNRAVSKNSNLTATIVSTRGGEDAVMIIAVGSV